MVRSKAKPLLDLADDTNTQQWQNTDVTTVACQTEADTFMPSVQMRFDAFFGIGFQVLA